MNLNEFYPYQVCINLDKRPDRWARVTARFAEHGINRVVRFPAVDGEQVELPPTWRGSPGAYGCLRSHLAVVEQARREAQPSVLIFEDDAVLAPEFSAKFADYVEQLPEDWDMIFFGGLHGQPPTSVAGNVMRVTHSLSTYAYALRQTIYDGFIELNQQARALLDENTRALQKRFKCYCFMPHLAWVEEDYSNISGELSNLWWLKESLVLFGAEVEEVLQKTVAIVSHQPKGPGSLRNLGFTLNYLAQRLPGITLLVLAQGPEPSLNQSDLPRDCYFELIESCGCHSRGHALKRGFEFFESGKDFFIFLDSDVFLTREDIRANLLKCRDCDFVSAFRALYELDRRDTLRILKGDVRWDYDGAQPSRAKGTIFDAACIISRKALRLLLGAANSEQSEAQLTLRAEALLKGYDSPNLARRLSSG
jgi:GR25 family glycosyltransferase involved in LPS biosynthesis